MSDYVDLEIEFSASQEGKYNIDLRYIKRGTNTISGEKSTITLNPKTLRKFHLNNEDYGQTLVEHIFEQKNISQVFSNLRNEASLAKVPLRLRFNIDWEAVDLHSLRWETLVDPENHSKRLFTDPNCLFSRFILSSKLDAFKAIPKGELNALVAIANPKSLDGHAELHPVDVEGELARAKEGLSDIAITALGKVEDQSQFDGIDIKGTATLSRIQDELHKGYAILYLACHGSMFDGQAELWLDPDEADSEPKDTIPSVDLVSRLQALEHPPLLVVLASCQSAGTGDQPRTSDKDGILAALGPQLARAGIPAVLAMQGSITMETVKHFMPILFRELIQDGRIDRAVAIARSRVQGRRDWWMPVLFMRSTDGRLWKPDGLPEDLEKRLPIDMVRIPAGKFWLGCPEEEEGVRCYEKPRHQVALPTYYIGCYPVTNKEYANFVAAKNWAAPKKHWKGLQPAKDKLNHPVMGVSWYDAMKYCEWLSNEFQEEGFRFRLPTEAEWEKAARGKSGEGPFPWGEWDEQTAHCNYGGSDTAAVDAYGPQSDYGCYDLVGNGAEWTISLCGQSMSPDEEFYYEWDKNLDRNKESASKTIYRIYRGGFYSDSNISRLRCGARRGQAPDKAGEFKQLLGFRVVLEVPQ